MEQTVRLLRVWKVLFGDSISASRATSKTELGPIYGSFCLYFFPHRQSPGEVDVKMKRRRTAVSVFRFKGYINTSWPPFISFLQHHPRTTSRKIDRGILCAPSAFFFKIHRLLSHGVEGSPVVFSKLKVDQQKTHAGAEAGGLARSFYQNLCIHLGSNYTARLSA
jgi:hypothetical protein